MGCAGGRQHAPRDFSQDTIEFLTATAALIGAFLQGHGDEPSEAARLATAAMEAQNRDVLLREMQHRVKNNFQIILASIAIQKRRYSAGDAQRALDHIASRINAISLAHDQLAPREEGQIVNFPTTCVRFVFPSSSRPRGSRSTCRPTSSSCRSIVQYRSA